MGALSGVHSTAEDDDMGRSGRPQLAKELVYFERAKQRLRNKDAYSDFLKCLSMYTQEIISRQELLQLLNDVIGRFPELMVGTLLVHCHEQWQHCAPPEWGHLPTSLPSRAFGNEIDRVSCLEARGRKDLLQRQWAVPHYLRVSYLSSDVAVWVSRVCR